MNEKEAQFAVFVGHVFEKQQLDDFRGALDSALSEVRFIKLVYADTARYYGSLLPKITQLINSSLFCIFEVSDQNPNVFLELGYALGRRKLCVILARSDVTPPSDIAGSERITYNSYKELGETIKRNAQGFLQAALNRYGTMVEVADIEFLWYLRNHRGGQEVDVEEMKRELRKHGLSGLNVDTSIDHFCQHRFIEKLENKTVITPLGEDFILTMIKSHPDLSKRNMNKSTVETDT